MPADASESGVQASSMHSLNVNGNPLTDLDLIATPEKALCDALYKTRGIESIKALEALLFEDWRMEREAVLALDRPDIIFLAPRYRKKIFRLLLKWLGGEANHA